MIFILSLRHFPFNKKFDGVFKNTYSDNITVVEASGSMYAYDSLGKTDVLSKPENVIDPSSHTEWCSNVNKSKSDRPWLLVSFKKSIKLKLSGYSMRSGCCNYGDGCCCRLNSWSLLGSNDNATWTTIHKVDDKTDFYHCDEVNYEINSERFEPFTFFKLVQDKPYKNCWFCIELSRVELYGKLDVNDDFNDVSSNDDEVSIIGKVSRDA